MTSTTPAGNIDFYVPAETDADLRDASTADAAQRGLDAVPPSALMDDDYWAKFPEPLTLHAIATVLRVSEATVLRRLQDGTIPGHFIGRSWIIFQCEFRAWLATTRNEPLPADVECDPLADYDDQLGMSELMELFNKTKQTIRAWLGNNTLPGYQVAGRWTVYKSELRDTLAKTSNQPSPGESSPTRGAATD
jgi:hypothetical protein